jgi:hypothetical protein
MEETDTSSLFSLSIGTITKAHLTDTAKWARFLAIAGIVLLCLGVLFTVLTLTVLPNTMFTGVTYGSAGRDEMTTSVKIISAILILIFFVIAFLPMWYLLQFANKMKTALYSNDQEALNNSFLNIKRYFRYVGIITIIVLAIYGLAFVMVIITAAMT